MNVAAYILSLFLSCMPALAWAKSAYVMRIDGAITPPVSSYIEETITQAKLDDAEVIIIELDTPGGLLSTTRDIGQQLLTSDIPVVTYVSPQGARAASAGTFILYASHIAAMAPSTHLGSATPITLGNEEQPNEAANKKIMNDTLAYIQSLAEYHDRNAQFGVDAVLDATSITANQALKIGAIEVIADNIPSLIKQINGRNVRMQQGFKRLDTTDITIKIQEPSTKNRILTAISDPTIAYLMLMAGLYGIMIEFFNPGSIIPGVVGAICLLIASYSLQILPISYAGIGLILLGVAFLIAESFIPSFGIFGIAGVVSLAVGSFFLLQMPAWAAPSAWVLLPTLGTFIFATLWLVRINIRTQLNRPVSGLESLVGVKGRIIQFQDPYYEIHVAGEIWQAYADNPDLPAGTPVEIVKADGLTLTIEPLGDRK